MFKNEDIQK